MDFQSLLYGLTLLCALVSAFFGILVAERMANKKTLVSNSLRLIFALLAIGYTSYALGELCWYLIFKVFNQLPQASMPDFYWVVGSSAELLGFLAFTVYAFRTHREHRQLLPLAVFAAVVLAVTSLFLNRFGPAGLESTGEIFLAYFYPVIGSLILIFSFTVYLFLEKIEGYKSVLLLFLFANAASLIGDFLYLSYSLSGIYGLAGIVSDLLYIATYSFTALAFMLLLRELSPPVAG